MSVGDVLVWILVPAAATTTLLSAIGMERMRDPYQRLHYLSPGVAVGGVALAVAAWIADGKLQVGAKVTLAVCLLLATNAVVTHATAKAMYARRVQPSHPSHPPQEPRP